MSTLKEFLDLTEEQKAKILKSHGWRQFWADNVWVNKPNLSDFAGSTTDEAIKQVYEYTWPVMDVKEELEK